MGFMPKALLPYPIADTELDYTQGGMMDVGGCWNRGTCIMEYNYLI